MCSLSFPCEIKSIHSLDFDYFSNLSIIIFLIKFCISSIFLCMCVLNAVRRHSLTLFSTFLLTLVAKKSGDLGSRVLTREWDTTFRIMLISFLFRRTCWFFFGSSFVSKLIRVIDDAVLFDIMLSFTDEFLDDDVRSD